MIFNILLFDGFESLDIFGPIEVFGSLEEAELRYYAMTDEVTSAQGTVIKTIPLTKSHVADMRGILVLPGGQGTRSLVQDVQFLDVLKTLVGQSTYCLSICTGSAVLAKAGILDGRKATSNKNAFQWVMSCSDLVDWQPKARWVVDGKFYTASGISAGIDMALGFVRDRFSDEEAKRIAMRMEYSWNEEADEDPFAVDLNI